MNKDASIYVSGHNGLVGSALVRKLNQSGYTNIVTCNKAMLDLRNQHAVNTFLANHKPEYIFHAAAKVGGIQANNTLRADFIFDNLLIQTNVIHAAYLNGCKKLLFLASSSIYPRNAEQPIKEEYLLGGPLEPTNEPYAVAKIAGIKMCDAYRHQYGCNFITAIPANLYGFNDHYDLQHSHVVPSLVRKFCEAKQTNAGVVELWGSGKPRREFLHADDLADACIYLMKNYNETGAINVGTGSDFEISEIASIIQQCVGFSGNVFFDSSRPDGIFRKLLDVTKLHQLGWQHKIEFREGIKDVVAAYLQQNVT
jgi:GDP-L-fucose synthase